MTEKTIYEVIEYEASQPSLGKYGRLKGKSIIKTTSASKLLKLLIKKLEIDTDHSFVYSVSWKVSQSVSLSFTVGQYDDAKRLHNKGQAALESISPFLEFIKNNG